MPQYFSRTPRQAPTPLAHRTAHEGNEANRVLDSLDDPCHGALDDTQLLVPPADRNDQTRPHRELFDERRRHRLWRSRHHDAIEWRVFGQAGVTVARLHLDVVVTELAESPASAVGQRPHDLDAVDVRDEASQHRRLIAGAGADLEHAIVRLGIEQFGHGGHDVGLRDRLAVADRERSVVMRARHVRSGNEAISRDIAHRRQHPRIAYPARFDLLADHPVAKRARVDRRIGVRGTRDKRHQQPDGEGVRGALDLAAGAVEQDVGEHSVPGPFSGCPERNPTPRRDSARVSCSDRTVVRRTSVEARDRDSARVVEWLEAHFGGRVRAIARQPRWRPVWFADVERDGETLALCVRGDRSDAQIGFTLYHEMRFQQLLGERDIPVARVHGWLDAPRAYVMDRVDGQPDFDGTSAEDRHRAMDDYISILARIHALDPEPFAAAGILRAPEPAQSGLIGIQAYEQAYRRRKKRPDPFLEFCLSWLARNPVDTHSREAPIVWDSGQFHQRDGRILAVLDLEIGHIGDPMMDLAGFRMRDTILGFGDFGELYDRYAEITGEPVDIAAIQHHHLAFTLTNQLAFHAALADPPDESDFMTNLQWCSETNLFAVEALAEILGLELPPVEIPEPRESPIATAHRHLVTSLRALGTGDPNTQHAVRILFRLARHTARFDEIGDATSEADLDDLGDLMGRRPASWQEGDAALEHYVQADGGAHDTELVLLFHRRLTRLKALLGPAGSAMVRHLPIQPFGTHTGPGSTNVSTTST